MILINNIITNNNTEQKYYYVAFWRGNKVFILSKAYKSLLYTHKQVNKIINEFYKNHREFYRCYLYGKNYGVIGYCEKLIKEKNKCCIILELI